jgi:hypothetical protein
VDPKSLELAYTAGGQLVSATSPQAVQRVNPQTGQRITIPQTGPQTTILPQTRLDTTTGQRVFTNEVSPNLVSAAKPPVVPDTTVKPITTVSNTTTGAQIGTATPTQLVQTSAQGQIEQAMRDAGMSPEQLDKYAAAFGRTPDQIKALFADAAAKGGVNLSVLTAAFKDNIASPAFQKKLAATSQIGTAATTSGILRGLPNLADTQTLSETSGGTVLPSAPTMTSRDEIMGPSTEEQIAADKARLANIEAEKEKARDVVPPKVVRQETVGQTVYDVYDNETRQINQGATSVLQAQALQAQREAEAKAQREAQIKAENDRIAREKKVQTDAIARQQQADIERNTPLGARRGRNAAWQSAIGGAASGVGAQRTF